MSFPLFVDIAKFQPSDSEYFKRLAKNGAQGCFVQLNYGYGFPNPSAITQCHNSLQYLKFTGCYEFFLDNPVPEAHYFLWRMHKCYMNYDKTTPVMLDVEMQSGTGPQTHLINEWTTIVYNAGFHNIWIYAPSSWLSDSYHVKPELLKHGHIWAAAYDTNEPGVQADAWQYTNDFSKMSRYNQQTDGDMLFKPLSVMTGKTSKTKPVHKSKPAKKPATKPKPKPKVKVQTESGVFKVTGKIERLK